MKKFLESTNVIDWNCHSIKKLAQNLAQGYSSDTKIAKRTFEWVRDNIKHSYDFKLNPVTCKASEVLFYKTGYCFAKSHLLAALLRANGIPAALCYQRLSIDGHGSPYSLHGLNAVYLEDFGWYRIDARGNKPGIDAQFCPPRERLAFATNLRLEENLPGIRDEPLRVVVETLSRYKTYIEVYENLPDI